MIICINGIGWSCFIINSASVHAKHIAISLSLYAVKHLNMSREGSFLFRSLVFFFAIGFPVIRPSRFYAIRFTPSIIYSSSFSSRRRDIGRKTSVSSICRDVARKELTASRRELPGCQRTSPDRRCNSRTATAYTERTRNDNLPNADAHKTNKYVNTYLHVIRNA